MWIEVHVTENRGEYLVEAKGSEVGAVSTETFSAWLPSLEMAREQAKCFLDELTKEGTPTDEPA